MSLLKRKRSGGALINFSFLFFFVVVAFVFIIVSINNISIGLIVIVIFSVNFSNVTFGYFNVNLSVVLVSGGGKNVKNNVYKDFGFVVINLDSVFMNG